VAERLTPRILVTNDDGIDSPGLHRLARAARAASEHVVVAAPAQEASGSSAALTVLEDHGRIPMERRVLAGLDGVPAHAVSALPGFIALIACQGAFGPAPDLVCSGINRGANTGHAVMHSGTVGAALTAGVDGRRALAVSLDVGTGADHWDSAAHYAGLLLPQVLAAPPGTIVNLNVPNLPLTEIRGLRYAVLAPFGCVQTTVAERGHDFVQVSVDETDPDPDLHTDAGLLAAGYAAWSVLQPVTETPPPAWAVDVEADVRADRA
jgi:5'-nucleotidase